MANAKIKKIQAAILWLLLSILNAYLMAV